MLKIGFLVAFFFLLCVRGHDDDTCIPVRRFANEIKAEVRQGHPGKRGAVGPEGQKGSMGQKGEPGECPFDPSEIEDLRSELQNLRVRRCSVGMRSGTISNTQITASSVEDGSPRYYAYLGRLDNTGTIYTAGCWTTRTVAGEWLQVDLGNQRRVTAVVTQGRPGGFGAQWVTGYKILYGDSVSNLIMIRKDGSDKIFEGNTDFNSYKVNYFPQPVTARFFRLVVMSWHNYISLRMDFITC